jgi:hypothetical protein
MRRVIVLLALAIGLGALGAMACGGPDKPPLTPDGDNPLPPEAEAGAPTPPPAK